MSKHTDFKALSFDVYGALIDWETGILDNLQPLLKPTRLLLIRGGGYST